MPQGLRLFKEVTGVGPVNPRNLLTLVRQLCLLQAREVARGIRLESPTPDLTHWVGVWANALKPVMLNYWLMGMNQVGVKGEVVSPSRMDDDGRSYNLGNDSVFGVRKGVMWNEALHMLQGGGYSDVSSACNLEVNKVGGVGERREYPPPYVSREHPAGLTYNQLSRTPHILSPRRHVLYLHLRRKNAVYLRKKGINASKITPRVMDAVDALTLQFCRETNETATKELGEALDRVRSLLKRGLSRGDAVGLLARGVGKIFADPMKAYRIAVTESVRALNAGQLMGARDVGYGKKVWVYKGGCDRCKKLGGRRRSLDVPFWVDSLGGSYGVVNHPPLHPYCRCGVSYE